METLDRYTAFQARPKEPKAEISTTPERYREARTPARAAMGGLHGQEEIRRERAEITVYAKIGQKEIAFCYVENMTEGTDSGRNARTCTALSTRGEVEKLGRAQQGNRTRTTR